MDNQAKKINQTETVVLEQPEFLLPKKQVGILGGSFNPVHLSHLAIAEQVLQQLALEKVYLMPSYQAPHVDEKKTIDAHYRKEMIQLAIQDNPNLELEMIELKRKGKSYTYDTMKQLKEQNPTTEYFFIIGGDMVEYLPKWYKIDELLHLVTFVGVRRPEYEVETPYPIIWVDVPQMDISSTWIRKHVQKGCSVRYFLPDSVINYIYAKGLYIDEI